MSSIINSPIKRVDYVRAEPLYTPMHIDNLHPAYYRFTATTLVTTATLVTLASLVVIDNEIAMPSTLVIHVIGR